MTTETCTKCLADPLDRAKVLLRAAHDILRKSDESPYVVSALELTAHYDGTECDGGCLGMDIEHWFESEAGETLPEHFK